MKDEEKTQGRDLTDGESAEDIIENHRRSLEQMIRERTFELEAANKALRQQIEERKRVEQALLEREEKYKALIETTGTGFVILDAQGRVLDANQEYVRLTGYQKLEEILGRSVLEWSAKHDLERNAEEVRKCLERGFVRDLEIDYLNKDGRFTPLEINATVLRSPSSTSILTLCRDISDRKNAEARLRESEERYRKLFNLESDAIIVVDNERGQILEVNDGAVVLYGYGREEWLRMKNSDVSAEPDKTRQAMAERRSSIPVRWHRKKDGTIFPLEITVSFFEMHKREVHLAAIRDISERVRTETLIRDRLEFESVISAISTRFIGVYDLHDAINASLADMGRLSGAHRSYVFLFRSDGENMDNTHEWCAEGVSAQINNLQGLATADFPWVMSRLLNRETVHIEDISALAEEAVRERTILESQGIKSLLLMPVIVGSEVAGFLGFDDIAKPGRWKDSDVALLRITSEIMGNALERKRFEDELHARSIRDELTGLYNRRGFIFLAEQQIRLAERMAGSVCVLFADMDSLKLINDKLGHEEGDRALVDAAAILKNTFRDSDVIARYGGDEFAVVAIEKANVDTWPLSFRLESQIKAFNSKKSRPYNLSLSWGVTFHRPGVPCKLDELMRQADERMYGAKQRAG